LSRFTLQARQAPAPTTTIQGSKVCIITPPDRNPQGDGSEIAPQATVSSDPISTVGAPQLLIDPEASPSSVAPATEGPPGQVSNTEPVITYTQLNSNGVPISTEVFLGDPITRLAIDEPVMVTHYDINGQPTATQTLVPITTVVKYNSKGQPISTFFINDPITTETFYNSAGQPITTTIMNDPLTKIIDSNGEIIYTALTRQSNQSKQNASSSGKPSLISGTPTTMITSSTDPSTVFVTLTTSSPAASEARSILNGGVGRAFWSGVFGVFTLLAFF
jgi:hypothetical protein